ncbi:hypothetical protein ACSSS7_000772 [Eimeria intestinalis]
MQKDVAENSTKIRATRYTFSLTKTDLVVPLNRCAPKTCNNPQRHPAECYPQQQPQAAATAPGAAAGSTQQQQLQQSQQPMDSFEALRVVPFGGPNEGGALELWGPGVSAGVSSEPDEATTTSSNSSSSSNRSSSSNNSSSSRRAA